MEKETRTEVGGGTAREVEETRLKKLLERGEGGRSKVLRRVLSGQGRGADWLPLCASCMCLITHSAATFG